MLENVRRAAKGSPGARKVDVPMSTAGPAGARVLDYNSPESSRVLAAHQVWCGRAALSHETCYYSFSNLLMTLQPDHRI